ncbi:UNVERIFIED_CONTAM: hypothetical protein Sradi_4930900 [Sesamum radiatum]|uniref:Uncharacterized protein n=1 Tax=Sesamum radiatum TaxID=300843 RepID=A0AAW2MG60_SESRA
MSAYTHDVPSRMLPGLDARRLEVLSLFTLSKLSIKVEFLLGVVGVDLPPPMGLLASRPGVSPPQRSS